jgi:hypothetical protein
MFRPYEMYYPGLRVACWSLLETSIPSPLSSLGPVTGTRRLPFTRFPSDARTSGPRKDRDSVVSVRVRLDTRRKGESTPELRHRLSGKATNRGHPYLQMLSFDLTAHQNTTHQYLEAEPAARKMPINACGQKDWPPADVKNATLGVTVHSTLRVPLSRLRVHPGFSAVFDMAE